MSSSNSTETAEKLSIQDVQALLNEFGDLHSITPEEAISLYIQSREGDVSTKTKKEYKRKLENLETYCKKEDIKNLNDFGGREIAGYSKWRKNESSEKVDKLAKKTMRDELYLLRDFLNYLESIDGVKRDTADKVNPPTLKNGEGVRDVELEIDYLRDVTSYLAQYHYASREHVSIKIFEVTGRRLGGVHSLDLCDAHVNQSSPYLDFKHHDDGYTRLKNNEKSEQQVNISKELAELIGDYIKNQRIEKEIDGRKPLLTTSQGRLAKSTIRTYFYKWTRPCKIGKSCPDNRDPEDCQAASSKDHASKCPDSEAPHATKHGYLTHMMREGVPKEVLSDRCDVSEEIIEKHYDERTTEEKRELRRKIIAETLGEGDDS
ncbi:tyrosine-type recombinase/integrase [Halohasta litorea]|uniref:Tyrosine-type recombinase/integrase n=1 Tax=Halohasta litorea TaxID=869891 RepID=A0ABD6DC96_9EURY|nr:site-specific integrase [Halohasta litorea]